MHPETAPSHALSLRQPWAALLAHGLKTIEVRRWPTARRGRILIHASRVPDERPEAWAHVPEGLRDAARQMGGIIGACEITGCLTYHTQHEFAADRDRHLNEPDWFVGPALYGFTIANPAVTPFFPYPGWVRFFPVVKGGGRGHG